MNLTFGWPLGSVNAEYALLLMRRTTSVMLLICPSFYFYVRSGHSTLYIMGRHVVRASVNTAYGATSFRKMSSGTYLKLLPAHLDVQYSYTCHALTAEARTYASVTVPRSAAGWCCLRKPKIASAESACTGAGASKCRSSSAALHERFDDVVIFFRPKDFYLTIDLLTSLVYRDTH